MCVVNGFSRANLTGVSVVRYECKHSHCFVCIRQWLEKSFHCPQCRAKMEAPPLPHQALERQIAELHPTWSDPSIVTYSYSGLKFPQPFPTDDFF